MRNTHTLATLALILAACGSKATPTPTGPSNTSTKPHLVNSLPANGALNVAADTAFSIEFDQDVVVSGQWLILQCSSGSLSNEFLSVTGGPRTYQFPAVGLPPGEVCFINLVASNIKAGEQTPAGDISIGFLVKGTAPSAANDTVVADRRNGLQSEDGALLENDDRGAFPAVVVAFGGGGVSSAVDLPAGQFAEFGSDGLVGISETGQLILLPPSDSTENITFSYVIANYAGTSTATITASVVEAPLPVRDNYVAVSGQPLVIAANNGVLANDEAGIPAATLIEFGGGSFGDNPRQFDAGATASVTNATLVQNADGGFTLTPTAGFKGTLRWIYVMQNSAGLYGGEVVVNVVAPPVATADLYDNLVVNTPLYVGPSGPSTGPAVVIAGSLLTNDTAGSGTAALTALAGTVGTAQGGLASIAADGTFNYTPPLDYAGSDSFVYRITDGLLTVSGTATMIMNSARVLYVDRDASNGNGSVARPFTTASQAWLAPPADPVSGAARIVVFLSTGTHTENIAMPARTSLLGRTGGAVTVTAGSVDRTILAQSVTETTVQSIVAAADVRIAGLSIASSGVTTALRFPSGATGAMNVRLQRVECTGCASAQHLVSFAEANSTGLVSISQALMDSAAASPAISAANYGGDFVLGTETNQSVLHGLVDFSNTGSVTLENVVVNNASSKALQVARSGTSNSILDVSNCELVTSAVPAYTVSAEDTATLHIAGYTGAAVTASASDSTALRAYLNPRLGLQPLDHPTAVTAADGSSIGP